MVEKMPKHAGGRPTKYDPKMCDQYIDLAKEGKSRLTICSELGIGFDAYQDYQEKYPRFSEAVKEGNRFCQAWWEEKGREGMLGKIQNFNPTTFIFNMKNRFKEDWRDKHEQEVSGKDGGPIEVRGLSATAELISTITSKRS